MENVKTKLIRYSYPSGLTIGGRDGDSWQIDICWPLVFLANDTVNQRFDFYLQGRSLIRLSGSKNLSWFGFGLVLLGFGFSIERLEINNKQ